MCGRYSLALRPSQVRAYLEDENLPVYEAPDDEGELAPRQSYNFAPGYHGIVYRASVPDWGAGPRHSETSHSSEKPAVHEESTTQQENDNGKEGEEEKETRYELSSMKWGLIPHWTKRKINYGSMMKTINCRDDSLIENRGMWNSMKGRKRCVVVAQGFYEWLKKGPGGKEKVPHYVKRKDGRLMLLAGLGDCVRYEGEEQKHYTYTIITTSSSPALKFLHDRMPAILDHNSSSDLHTWLDPKRHTWSKELQSLLKPYEGELEIYPVSKEVGKVGNNSSSFIVPLDSRENRNNIKIFFGGAGVREEDGKEEGKREVNKEPDENRKTVKHEGKEDNALLPIPKGESKQGIKRELSDVEEGDEKPTHKAAKTSSSTISTPKMKKEEQVEEKASPEKDNMKSTRKTRSATSNGTADKSPKKGTATDGKGSQKISSFFKK